MDFPGGNITNVHVIDGFSSIHWRIYTEEPGITNHPSETPTNGHTILKHLSRLKDFELRLRNLGCLVSCYPRRLGLWVFSSNSNFDSLAPLNQGNDGLNRLQVGSLTLKVSASGSVSSRELVRTLSTEPQAPNVNTARSQRSQNVPNPPRRIEGYGTSAAIYASFISAVTGAISLQLIRRHGAIPLGSRTLFTAVEKDGYETRIANDSYTATPSLSILHIQLTSGGKLTVALQTIAQHGMSRLQSPKNGLDKLRDTQPGLDIWLSPNATVARLVSFNTSSQDSISPNPSGGNDASGLAAVKRSQWKQCVLEWLGNFGLLFDSHEEEQWIEVEVWEPFYSRLAGEIFRQSEEGPTAFPLKRILWPARYCFRRTKSIALDASYGKQDSCHLMDSPLGLADEWHVTGNFVHDEATSIAPSGGFQDQPMRDSEISPSKAEFPEPLESLSRIAQYPDLQATNLVYPTPPDGATALSSDMFADQPDLSLPQTQHRGQPKLKQASFKEQADSGITMDIGPSAGLTVGSGLYDMNGDDDLFGEINDRDFGTRGITDADFSFFDDPDFGDMGGAPAADNTQSTPNIAEANLKEDDEQPSPDFPLPDSHVVTTAEGMNAPQTDVAEQEAVIPSKRETSEIRMSSPREESSQPISPPLSPVEVKKILFSESDDGDQSTVKRERKQSHFTPVSFKQKIGDWNQKYGAEGRFWFSGPGVSTVMESVNPPNDIPTIGLPRRSGKAAVKFDNPAVTDEQDVLSGDAKGSSHSTSDSSSVSSDDDDSDEVMSEREPSPVNLTRKRKRAQSNTSGSITQVLSNPLVENAQLVSASKAENSTFLGNLLSTFSDWSLLGYFSVSQNQQPPTISQKDEQIQVAQLLVDQITQSSLDHVIDGQIGLSGLDNEMYTLRNIFEDTVFTDEVGRLDLKSYALLQNDSSPPSSEGLTPHQLPQRKEAAKGTISKLLPPHLRIRRGKGYLEALPPAISFWETFDLEPAHGPKDISAYCIHPRVMTDAADAFLERLGLLYSACNLGNHARGDMCFERGLGSWNTEVSSYLSTVQSLRGLCEELGNALSGSQPRTENFVVYVINPFTHAAALADICAAFWQLFQKYIMGTDNQQAGKFNELVLQIIPISFVMSPESIVVPSQSDYLSLALEVYSRCPSKDSESNLVHCAPPVLLTESAPKAISFKLVPERLSPLQDGRSLHIACSRSLDQRWITVAWSDNTGAIQRMMSYCLRYRNSGAVRGISDVRNEIWGTTQTIMDRIQARWRIIIVNTEPVDQDELDTWTNLAEQHNKSKPIPLDLMILHVNATTDFSLEPPSLLIPTSVFNAQASSTPVATPGPSAASPDQYGSAPTPTNGGSAPMSATTPDFQPESESDFFLADIRDESWNVILSHRLNSSPYLTEYRPALASGYLLRRKGPTDGDGVFATNVNLIHSRHPTSSHETLLKEILGMYHDLAILARARGTRCVQRNTLPWHIATAVRAQELLSYVF